MGNDAVELEAMRKEDSSWHPCQISLSQSPSDVILIVECEGNGTSQFILHKDEVTRRVRVRSLPLQGDDCSNIKPGDHILATHESQAKNLFFDAVVEKVTCVRHSKRTKCRCTFMVKLLHQDFKEAFVVPSSSVMKLSTESLNSHPTVSKFFNIVKDKDSEMDHEDSPKKQRGGYSIKDSKKKVDTKAQVPQNSNPQKRSTRSKNKLTAEIEVNPTPSPSIQEESPTNIKVNLSPSLPSFLENRSPLNPSKRSTRSKNKLPVEIKVNPKPSPSIQKEPATDIKVNPSPSLPSFLENRSPLNPLAARAALASLISRLPRNLEFSNHKETNKSFTNSVVEKSSMIDKLCSKIENGSNTSVPKDETTVKSLFCASLKQDDAKGMKLSSGTKRRVTPSRNHKDKETRVNGSTKEISECASSVQNNLSDKRRLTRSSGRSEARNVNSEVIQGLGDNKVYDNAKSNLYLGAEKKPVYAQLEEGNLPATAQVDKKRKKSEAGNVESDEVVKKRSSSSKILASRSSPRFSQNKS